MLVLGLFAMMLAAPFITGRILAIAQAPIAEEKAPELDRIVFMEDPERIHQEDSSNNKKMISIQEHLVLLIHVATVQVNMP